MTIQTNLVSSHWWRHGQQKRCPHMEITASEATSRQMLHSKAESFRSFSSSSAEVGVTPSDFDFSLSGLAWSSLLRAPVSEAPTFSLVLPSSSSESYMFSSSVRNLFVQKKSFHSLFCKNILQSNSVITKSRGPALSVRYNRDSL